MAHPLAELLRKRLTARPNPKRAAQAAAYMKVALPFVGLALPEVRRIAKEALRGRPFESFADYQAFLKEAFLRAECQEQRYAALAVSSERACRPYQTARVLPLYRRMILAAQWWDLVDDLACRVGDALLNEPEAVAPTVRAWAHDDNLWLRRTAIVCQRKLKGQTDVALLYDCLEPSLDATDFFLRKGIGWALRAYAYEDPAEVKRYLKAQAGRLSPLSRREAAKHIR